MKMFQQHFRVEVNKEKKSMDREDSEKKTISYFNQLEHIHGIGHFKFVDHN